MKKYGIFIGRFQPFHKGHQAMIDTIISDGLTPLIIVGSVNSTDKIRNPYPFEDVSHMIQLVYPEIKCLPLPDYHDDEKWSAHLIQIIPSASIIYYCRKEEDLHDAKHYLDFIEEKGISLKAIYPNEISIPVRASLIRENIELYKDYLDNSVYAFIKNNRSCDLTPTFFNTTLPIDQTSNQSNIYSAQPGI
ncbi:MAG: adenylyltransferase/cytidyltransferase family protein [Gammaproteobacteria bacterium]|nr:adenylyltransferase/cytidyltransferase family protein [Gammaproteobacteria bacterium]